MNNMPRFSLKNSGHHLKNTTIWKFLIERLSFLKNRKQWIKGILFFVIVFALMGFIKDHVCLLYSTTASLPHRTFLKLKQMSPQKGDYTCFDSPWYGGNVVKKIVGVAGDSITYDTQGNLWVKTLWVKPPWIGRQLKVGTQKKKSKDGRLLTPIKPGIIPKGMVFVMGEHERSFDSRYEEMGLIPEHALQGRVIALL
jgi:conjugal transfer pilin signal peptidase TrbI